MTNVPSPKQRLQDIYQLVRQNKTQEARVQLQQYVKEHGPDADAYFISTFLTNDIHRKIQMCEKALALNPNHGPIMQLLGRLQAQLAEGDAPPAPSESFRDTPSTASYGSTVPTPKFDPVPEPDFHESAPFKDTWAEEQLKASGVKVSPRATNTARPNTALMFVAGLLLGLVVAGGVGIFAVSRLASQPTPVPIVLVVTATEPPVLPTNPPIATVTPLPPTRTRPPTFTPIPSRTPLFVQPTDDIPDSTDSPPSTFALPATSEGTFPTPIPGRPAPTITATPPLGAAVLNSPLRELSFTVKDAEYSTSLDKIIFVASDPDALYIYDPESQSQQTVALVRQPTCLSVSQDGNFAAVGHDAMITYVDLRTAEVVKTLDLTTTASDIVLLNTGWIVVMPVRDQWESLHLVQIETNNEALTNMASVYAGGYLQRHPDGTSLYYGTRGLSPEHMYHYFFDADKLTEARDWPYHGDYSYCGSFWVSADSRRIFGRCGTVFRSAPDAKQDMTYNGSLADAASIDGAAYAQTQGKLIALGRSKSTNDYYGSETNPDPLLVFTYNYDTLTRESVVALPAFRDGKNGDSGFLFLNAAGTRYYALLGQNARLNDRYAPSAPTDVQFGVVVGDVGSTTVAAQPTDATEAVTTSAAQPTVTKVAKTASPTVLGDIQPLTYQVSQAEYSKSLQRIVMISGDPLALHLYDPVNSTDTLIALPRNPTALALSSDGNFAAVGHDALVTYVDLKAEKVVKTFEVATNVTNILLANNGWLYVSGQKGAFGVEIATGLQGQGISGYARQHPDGQVYTIGDYGITRIDLTDPANPTYANNPYASDNGSRVCGKLWIAEDGKRLFTGCSTVLRSSPDAKLDRAYNGTLNRLVRVEALDYSKVSGKVLAIGFSQNTEALSDSKMIIYTYDTLSTDKIIDLPSFNVNGAAVVTHGKYVFFDPDGVHYSVIVQADSSSGLLNDFGIVRMQLTND
ncbi:MAG: hypothetical protein KF716_04905 [Anaerolineae bacterium]|nr:hypothetical protein [Anaerolineae bacterium]